MAMPSAADTSRALPFHRALVLLSKSVSLLISKVRKLPSCSTLLRPWKPVYQLTSTKLAAIFRGPAVEQPKKLASQSRTRAFKTLLVHFVRVSASCVVIAFSLKGYYFGAELPGNRDSVSQAIFILCLQVTAKLLVSGLLLES